MIEHNNPFVGLRPFETDESLYYFGRSEQIAELLTYLHKTHMVAVVGSSGCGKSSLVRAGLIPHLQAGFLVQDRDSWHIARLKPGDRPVYHLADALLVAFGEERTDGDTASLVNDLERHGIRALLKRFTPILEAKGSNLFILVDQFEEVFRYGLASQDTAGREEAAEFVDLLLKLAGQKEAPVYVCLTMRSDYMGECDAFFGLPEALNRSQYLVPRLTRMQRRQVIEGPIRLTGAAIEPRLVDRLLNDSGEYRDDLPLLQHALMRTWEHWQKQGSGDGIPLDLVHYEAIHTMKQALSLHVDEALEELSGEEQLLAKILFQLLTETDAENRQIRRSVHLDDIAAVTGASKERLMDIIDKFRRPDRAFLVLSASTPANNPLVDISHESLMRQWETLKKWMGEEANSAKIYKRLADAAALKEKGEGNLYIDPALQIALDWWESKKPNKAWANRYHEGFDNAMIFLDKSRAARDESIKEEQRQREQRERLLKEKADQKLRLIIFVALVIAVNFIFAIRMIILLDKKGFESHYNLARLFDEKAVNALESGKNSKDTWDYKDAWLNMTAALRQKIDNEKLPLKPSSAGALLSPDVVNAAFHERWVSSLSNSNTSTVNAVAFSFYGNIIAAAVDNNIRLMERKSKKEIAVLHGHSERVTSVAFSVDSKIIITGSVDKTVRWWDMESRGEIANMPGHTEPVLSVAISPDSKTIASGSEDNTIRLWDREAKKEIAKLMGHTDRVTAVAFSPDGKTIVSASWDETIRLWNSVSQKEPGILKGHSAGVTGIAISPDGRIIASSSNDKTVRLWDWETKNVIEILAGHSAPVTGVAFSHDGKTIASCSEDHTIRLWNRDTYKIIAVLRGHSGSITGASFSPDDKTIVSGASDNTIRLWDGNIQKKSAPPVKISSAEKTIAISPDGKTMASAAENNTIRLQDKVSQKEIAVLLGHTSDVACVVFSPDGKTIASGSFDKTIRLWDRHSKKEIAVLAGHTDIVTCVAFNPDGKMIASGSHDNTIRLWDRTSRKEIALLPVDTGGFTDVAFSTDGQTIIYESDNKTRFWDLRVFNLFLKGGKPTPLFFAFARGVDFYWRVRLKGFEYEPVGVPNINIIDKKFKLLMNEPEPGQTKFDQILQWAEDRVNEQKSLDKIPMENI